MASRGERVDVDLPGLRRPYAICDLNHHSKGHPAILATPMRTHVVRVLCLASALCVATSASPLSPFYQQGQEGDSSNEVRLGETSSLPSSWSGPALHYSQTPFWSKGRLDSSEGDERDDDAEDDEEDDNGAELIRHGEKVKKSDKTGLSERGIRRAKCLTDVFGGQGPGTHDIDYILAQDFKPTGQRRRPYETVKPLAKQHHIPLDHSCDRDDTRCAAHKIKKKARKGKNVLVVWEHARLSHIADALGVRGLVYPSERYDIVFKLRGGKVHSIFSEECEGLDGEYIHWKAERKGRHGKSPSGGRLVDDESWADN